MPTDVWGRPGPRGRSARHRNVVDPFDKVVAATVIAVNASRSRSRRWKQPVMTETTKYVAVDARRTVVLANDRCQNVSTTREDSGRLRRTRGDESTAANS